MKYYDGMGKDVTDYVTALEQVVAKITKIPETPPKVDLPMTTPIEIKGSEMEETPKPTRRKLKKVADT